MSTTRQRKGDLFPGFDYFSKLKEMIKTLSLFNSNPILATYITVTKNEIHLFKKVEKWLEDHYQLHNNQLTPEAELHLFVYSILNVKLQNSSVRCVRQLSEAIFFIAQEELQSILRLTRLYCLRGRGQLVHEKDEQLKHFPEQAEDDFVFLSKIAPISSVMTVCLQKFAYNQREQDTRLNIGLKEKKTLTKKEETLALEFYEANRCYLTIKKHVQNKNYVLLYVAVNKLNHLGQLTEADYPAQIQDEIQLTRVEMILNLAWMQQPNQNAPIQNRIKPMKDKLITQEDIIGLVDDYLEFMIEPFQSWLSLIRWLDGVLLNDGADFAQYCYQMIFVTVYQNVLNNNYHQRLLVVESQFKQLKMRIDASAKRAMSVFHIPEEIAPFVLDPQIILDFAARPTQQNQNLENLQVQSMSLWNQLCSATVDEEQCSTISTQFLNILLMHGFDRQIAHEGYYDLGFYIRVLCYYGLQDHAMLKLSIAEANDFCVDIRIKSKLQEISHKLGWNNEPDMIDKENNTTPEQEHPFLFLMWQQVMQQHYVLAYETNQLLLGSDSLTAMSVAHIFKYRLGLVKIHLAAFNDPSLRQKLHCSFKQCLETIVSNIDAILASSSKKHKAWEKIINNLKSDYAVNNETPICFLKIILNLFFKKPELGYYCGSADIDIRQSLVNLQENLNKANTEKKKRNKEAQMEREALIKKIAEIQNRNLKINRKNAHERLQKHQIEKNLNVDETAAIEVTLQQANTSKNFKKNDKKRKKRKQQLLLQNQLQTHATVQDTEPQGQRSETQSPETTPAIIKENKPYDRILPSLTILAEINSVLMQELSIGIQLVGHVPSVLNVLKYHSDWDRAVPNRLECYISITTFSDCLRVMQILADHDFVISQKTHQFFIEEKKEFKKYIKMQHFSITAVKISVTVDWSGLSYEETIHRFITLTSGCAMFSKEQNHDRAALPDKFDNQILYFLPNPWFDYACQKLIVKLSPPREKSDSLPASTFYCLQLFELLQVFQNKIQFENWEDNWQKTRQYFVQHIDLVYDELKPFIVLNYLNHPDAKLFLKLLCQMLLSQVHYLTTDADDVLDTCVQALTQARYLLDWRDVIFEPQLNAFMSYFIYDYFYAKTLPDDAPRFINKMHVILPAINKATQHYYSQQQPITAVPSAVGVFAVEETQNQAGNVIQATTSMKNGI